MSAAAKPAVIAPGQTYRSVNDQISALVLGRSRRGWLALLALAAVAALTILFTITLVFTFGLGVLGVDIPVAWGFPIVNVVWWIGIGHAGTLISAVLLLMRQKWRTSINRFAEAMTLFAVAIAGMFPIIHLGRPWFFYWLVPYPATMRLWPQWRSPLIWDFFAIATYITVSLLFWYVGLIPDLGTLRDRARSPLVRRIYAAFALGWRGSAVHWARYRRAYLLLAALATPLVVSVHSVIALDFAVTLLPGYHSTIFPPYFVGGALFSGFAMVLTIALPLRSYYKLENLITLRHLDVIGKVMLTAGLVVTYGYAMEYFVAWYGGDLYERYVGVQRALGDYALAFWAMIGINVVAAQSLWFARVRRSPAVLFGLALVINVGMWLERYVIVFTSPARDFLPSSWGLVYGNRNDVMMLAGSIGLFTVLLLLFIRVLPAISIYEVEELVHEQREAPRP
jgi:molybdopterin-containing oxidoreductase family membrane subunit